MKTRVLTPRESAIQAVGRMVVDFRKWMIPETKLLSRWKTQKYAYAAAEGSMVDDIDQMIDSVRKKSIDLPIVVMAVRQISAPPELSQIIGVPQEIRTVIESDPLKRRVFLRTEPRTYHVQFVFLSNDTDSATSFTSQFCSYVRMLNKRRILVDYFLSPDLIDKWHLTIFENSLYPDSLQLDEKNLVAGMVDFDLGGLVPRVTRGLPPLYPDEFGEGSGVGGDANNPDHPHYQDNPSSGGGDGESTGWHMVVEADLFKDRKKPTFNRLKADPETGVKTSEDIVNKD